MSEWKSLNAFSSLPFHYAMKLNYCVYLMTDELQRCSEEKKVPREGETARNYEMFS